jgi:hypothetical protein
LSYLNNIISIEGKLYSVIRTISAEQVGENQEALKAWQAYLRCDRTFRGGDKYYLVNDIDDIEFEDI